MGARIAAHFANAGFPVDLLDVSDTATLAGLESVAKQKPVGFFTDKAKALITPGNFQDHLDRLRHSDWIVEAVSENLEIKRLLLERVAAVRSPGAIFSTNTSGIPLARITEGFPSELRQHFLGTHFFNPPRYLHLVEIIPGAETLPEVLADAASFCDLHLGKGVVRCKDTPNFIANRIGCFFGATIHQLTVEGDYTVEEVDALTGPLIGLPKSASFRLVDIIGLDVWVHVLRNLHELAPLDPARDRYVVPEFMERMMEHGLLGEKRGQGFYKRVGKGADKEIWAIDRKTLEYHPAVKVNFPRADLRTLVAGGDRVGRFLWPLFRDLLLYSAQMVPEISDRIVEIDRAMRWGFAFALGPFETWDALGVRATAERMQAEGFSLPANVERMLSSGAQSFYEFADRNGQPHTRYFDLNGGAYLELEPRPGVVQLADLRRARGVVRENAAAGLLDLGDGVLCLEFHSKMNSLDAASLDLLEAAIAEAAENYDALVIGNQGPHFSAGANLAMILEGAQNGDWAELDRAGQRFQQAAMAVTYSPRPVVAAPFGMTLGGGCEFVLHAARRASLRRDLYGPGGNRCRPDSRRRRLQGDAAAVRQPAPGIRPDRLCPGLDQRRPRPRTRIAPGLRWHLDESGAAHRRCQGRRPLPGARLRPRRPAKGYPGGRRVRLRRPEDGHPAGARGRLHHRIRYGGRTRNWPTS